MNVSIRNIIVSMIWTNLVSEPYKQFVYIYAFNAFTNSFRINEVFYIANKSFGNF